MPKGRRPRGVTPRPRSGAAAESTRLPQHRNGREELPRVRGQGGRPRGDTPRPRSGAVARRSYPTPLSPRPGAVAGRSYPASEVRGRDESSCPASKVRGGGQEELSHAPKPEARGSDREEQPHVQGALAAWAQEGQEEVAVRRHPSSKVRSSGRALLEQP